jgi:flagellar protein FliT
MSSSVQLLEDTGSALRCALAQRDWAAIGELDMQCRSVIESAMLESLGDEIRLRSGMADLVALYRELVSACQSEQRRLAGELIQLNQSRQSAKVYQMFG